MAKENINRDSLKNLNKLVKNLMAYEARQILIDQGKHRPVIVKKFNQRHSVPPEEIKRKILKIFQTNGYESPDIELLKYLSLKYLEDMIEFATANPSYKILSDRIKKGQYIFPLTLEIKVDSA